MFVLLKSSLGLKLPRVELLGVPQDDLGEIAANNCPLQMMCREMVPSNYPKTGCNPRKIQDLRAFSDSYLGGQLFQRLCRCSRSQEPSTAVDVEGITDIDDLTTTVRDMDDKRI